MLHRVCTDLTGDMTKQMSKQKSKKKSKQKRMTKEQPQCALETWALGRILAHLPFLRPKVAAYISQVRQLLMLWNMVVNRGFDPSICVQILCKRTRQASS